MDRRLRFLKGIEDSRMKNNPRFRLKGEQEAGVMKVEQESTQVSTMEVEISGSKELGYKAKKEHPVKRCKPLTFRNTTAGDVTIQFPTKVIFGQDTLKLTPAETPGAEQSLTVLEEAPLGTHPYAVFCHEGGVFAQGGSMPIIIINPKDD